jgi:hypothetical protein
VAHNGEFKALVRKRMEITGESYTQAMRQILEAAGTAVPSTGAEGGRPTRPALQRSVPRPWDPPQTEFPAIVPISTLPFGRSGQSAIAITGISAYSNGFEIFVTRLIRPDALGFDEDPVPGAPGGMLAALQPFQFSLQLADGRTVTSGRPHHGDAQPTEPILRSRGGGGTSHYLLTRWWAWPLPPSGPLEFICQLGTGEERVGIDAQLILDAAQRSVPVWPADEGWTR